MAANMPTTSKKEISAARPVPATVLPLLVLLGHASNASSSPSKLRSSGVNAAGLSRLIRSERPSSIGSKSPIPCRLRSRAPSSRMPLTNTSGTHYATDQQPAAQVRHLGHVSERTDRHVLAQCEKNLGPRFRRHPWRPHCVNARSYGTRPPRRSNNTTWLSRYRSARPSIRRCS